MSRLLPYVEWSKLEGTEAGPLLGHFDPARTTALVIERDGQVVGSWMLMSVVHAECLWIAPSERGRTSVARRLWALMRKTAQGMGVPVVATAAMSDNVRELLAHVGAVKVEGDHYAMKVT